VVEVEARVVGLTKVGLMNVGEVSARVRTVSFIVVVAGGGVCVGDWDDVLLVFRSGRKGYSRASKERKRGNDDARDCKDPEQ